MNTIYIGALTSFNHHPVHCICTYDAMMAPHLTFLLAQ